MGDTLAIEGIYSQGYGILAKKVMRDRTLPVGAKALYAYICTYAGSGPVAWPGRSLICKDLNISKNTYTRYLKLLKESDYIRVTQKTDNKGKFLGNTFTIVVCPQPRPKNEDTGKSPCTKNGDTQNWDTNSNRSLIDLNLNNSGIKEKLSTRAATFKNYQSEVGHELHKQTSSTDIGLHNKICNRALQAGEISGGSTGHKGQMENPPGVGHCASGDKRNTGGNTIGRRRTSSCRTKKSLPTRTFGRGSVCGSHAEHGRIPELAEGTKENQEGTSGNR